MIDDHYTVNVNPENSLATPIVYINNNELINTVKLTFRKGDEILDVAKIIEAVSIIPLLEPDNNFKLINIKSSIFIRKS